MSKTIIALFITLLSAVNLNAQITKLIIGVDGFTCSLCAKGIEEQFKSLDFVKSVKTDLKKTEFALTFKSNPGIELSKIRDAVNDGGFTVRDIKIEAKGYIRGSPGSGFYLVTPNTAEFQLKNINDKIIDGDKVLIKGKVNSGIDLIDIVSLKKL
ncbi:MAG: heavy-metal-associated domain-containing protein [Ignavibacteria bacterium]|nr:heavy-metal-associated domain-containing protein [Ignavibacteria bacterium]